MRKSKFFKLTAVISIFALMLTACSNSSDETAGNETAQTKEGETVEITDAHGTVTVPVNPKNVVSLDNRTFETLADWGIELAAAPKAVMPADLPYVDDESVE